MPKYTILNTMQRFTGTGVLILYNIKTFLVYLQLSPQTSGIMCKIITRDGGEKNRRQLKLQRRVNVRKLESGVQNVSLFGCVHACKGAGEEERGACVQSRISWRMGRTEWGKGKGIWKNHFKRAKELRFCHTIILPPLLGNSMKQRETHFLHFSESFGTQSSHHLFKCSDFQKSKWGKKGLLRLGQIQVNGRENQIFHIKKQYPKK